MNKRVMFCAAAISLIGAIPARAHDSPDWPKVQAEIKALPASLKTGDVAPAALEELKQKIAPMPGAAKSWNVIKVWTSGRAELWAGRHRPDGLLEISWDDLKPDLYDSTGLVKFDIAADGGIAAVSVSNLITPGAAISATVMVQVIANDFGTLTMERDNDHPNFTYKLTEFDRGYTISGSQADGVVERPTYSWHMIYGGWDAKGYEKAGEMERNHAQAEPDLNFHFDPRLGIFDRTDNGDDWAEALDWQIDGQAWHSQAVSAALTPVKKDQVLALFKRGFDLYKSGDFAGAAALMAGGLQIDPANYLGWFTLGEITKSKAAQGTNDTDDKDFARIYYQHTIDLAPDSPEAALAKGYLTALH